MVSGAWVFKGTRVPLWAVLSNMAENLNIDQVAELFPGVRKEQIKDLLDWQAHEMEEDILVKEDTPR